MLLPTAQPTFFADPPARKAVTPQRETKGGGDSPSVRARTAPPKRRGLLDRIEDWLRH